MSNEELIELCKQRDEQALSLLYTTYVHKMRKICCQYVADKEIVNDLLHDGFIIIFTSISDLRSPDKLESWMGKIMKNISLKYLEQCRSVVTKPLDDIKEDEEPLALSYDANEIPTYNTILEIIERLPKGYRHIFKLAVLEGLSHKEIARLLKIAPHSSSSQLSRAKNMLRKLLIQYRIVAGLLALSSIISLYIFLYTPKKQSKPKLTSTDKSQKEQQVETILLSDSNIYASNPRHAHAEPQETIKTKQEMVSQDNPTEKKDSTSLPERKTTDNQYAISDKNTPYGMMPSYVSNSKKNWTLSLSYSGGEKHTDAHKRFIPSDDIISGEPKEELKKSHHRMPVTFSLTLHKNINERWGGEIGLQYTHLRSDFTIIGDNRMEGIQKINYIGIPLKGTLNIWKQKSFSIYTSAGITLDIPVESTFEKSVWENGQLILRQKNNLYPSLQWSTSFGIGIQYQLAPNIGIYAEPNLHYYFNNGDNIETIRTEKPLNVTLPIGIRFSW